MCTSLKRLFWFQISRDGRKGQPTPPGREVLDLMVFLSELLPLLTGPASNLPDAAAACNALI
jgi:hypothetical protein